MGVSIIWGSSFILIKKGVAVYSPIQVAALRIVLSCLVLLPFAFRQLRFIKKENIGPILVIGWLGTAIPAFLFPLAQTQVDSALAAMVNTLVPLNTFVLGLLFFGTVFKWNKLIGVLIGLLGAFFLIFISSGEISINFYVLFIVLGGWFYATSTNTIKRYCQNIPPLALTLAAFLSSAPFAAILLFSTDFSHRFTQVEGGTTAFFYIVLLAVFGTALANVVFFYLTQRTNALFAASVTYLIPIVAMFWGILDGEVIAWNHLVGLGLSLLGVYIVSKG